MARDKKIDPDEVLASITPQPARRVVTVAMLVVLAVFSLSVAITNPPAEFGYMLFLALFGAGCLWLAYAIWQATGIEIELTRTELREAGPNGRILVTIDNLAKVDRGMFAFKPAGGFLARLKEPVGPVYSAGAWWRMGRTLAVGGVSARRQGKEIADLMIVLLVQRDQNL